LKDLNLIPKTYIVEKKNKIKKAYLSILILCIGLIALAVYLAPTIYEMRLKSDKSLLEQQVLQTNSYVALDKDFNTLKQAVESREQEGKLLDRKKLDMLGIVTAIEDASPEKLFILKLDTTGEDESNVKIALNGVADNQEIIASFIRNLVDDNYFKKVGLATVQKSKEVNGMGFVITLEGINKYKLIQYNSEKGFSIGYISGWKISQEKEDNVVIVENENYQTVNPASLEVLVETTDSQLDAFSKERQGQLENKLKNYKLEYSKKTRNSKTDAIKTMYYCQENGVKYQCLELCVIKDGKSYTVTYKSSSSSFENRARIIDLVLNSFSIN
jgi:hypothetical protein